MVFLPYSYSSIGYGYCKHYPVKIRGETMSDPNIKSLETEVKNIKEDIAEIKQDAKENNKYFIEVIDVLKENSIRQTEILKNQEKNQEFRFSQINDDIAGLRNDMKESIETNTKWYQNFISESTAKVIKITVIILLILSGAGVATGQIDIAKILGGL